MKLSRKLAVSIALSIALPAGLRGLSAVADYTDTLSASELQSALKAQSLQLLDGEVQRVLSSAQTAHHDFCATSSTGINSKVRFASVEIARDLGLDPKRDATVSDRIAKAIASIPCDRVVSPPPCGSNARCCGEVRCGSTVAWEEYFNKTTNLTSNARFLSLVGDKGFSPVKISWEDIGRYQGSVWGDRISDVGIWVRKSESDPDSAELALSVRRDANFSDKVLMVPAERIKIHTKDGASFQEKTLPERLRELGLTSKNRDKNVIVSNQFAIVPVPAHDMNAGGPSNKPPRAAFNFSIYPYGSTNFVITDVIEGSHEAVVGPGQHQLLFANVRGEKAPFTASRASDRQDLLALEKELKSKGMDADVQRYYLIQVPLKKDASGIELSNMGTPKWRHQFAYSLGAAATMEMEGVAAAVPQGVDELSKAPNRNRTDTGLEKVAIGTGETEGEYRTGSGFRGQRAEEPIRVTVVYFVTPVGEVTEADMQSFSNAFAEWDQKAIWGGSFVVPDQA